MKYIYSKRKEENDIFDFKEIVFPYIVIYSIIFFLSKKKVLYFFVTKSIFFVIYSIIFFVKKKYYIFLLQNQFYRVREEKYDIFFKKNTFLI
jgi:hypothetical protein